MCHASCPIASTSWVWLLRAMTVGSLSTMPRPLAYTSVLAVPRSMARSLASPALPALDPTWRAAAPPVPLGVGGEGLELPSEALHVRVHGARLSVAEPHDERPQQAENHSHAEIDQVHHGLSPLVVPPSAALSSE